MTPKLTLIINLLTGMEKSENWKSYADAADVDKKEYFGMTRGSRKIRSETLSPKTISNDS